MRAFVETQMAQKIDIPGTDESLSTGDGIAGNAMTLGTTVVGFAVAAGAASVGVKLWNKASEQSESVDRVDLV